MFMFRFFILIGCVCESFSQTYGSNYEELERVTVPPIVLKPDAERRRPLFNQSVCHNFKAEQGNVIIVSNEGNYRLNFYENGQLLLEVSDWAFTNPDDTGRYSQQLKRWTETDTIPGNKTLYFDAVQAQLFMTMQGTRTIVWEATVLKKMSDNLACLKITNNNVMIFNGNEILWDMRSGFHSYSTGASTKNCPDKLCQPGNVAAETKFFKNNMARLKQLRTSSEEGRKYPLRPTCGDYSTECRSHNDNLLDCYIPQTEYYFECSESCGFCLNGCRDLLKETYCKGNAPAHCYATEARTSRGCAKTCNKCNDTTTS